MATLRTILLAAALLVAAPGQAQSAAERIERWRPLIAEASRRFGIPEAWIAAVMRAESGDRTTLGGRPITSPAGAMGLMQLMPGTYEDMRRRHGLGSDPHNPRDNILAGTAYLKLMHGRFGYPGLFAAYNAGPARYAEHLRTGKPLPRETRAYIAALAHMPEATAMPPSIASGERLFFSLGSTRDRPAENASAGRLFVPLTVSPNPER